MGQLFCKECFLASFYDGESSLDRCTISNVVEMSPEEYIAYLKTMTSDTKLIQETMNSVISISNNQRHRHHCKESTFGTDDIDKQRHAVAGPSPDKAEENWPVVTTSKRHSFHQRTDSEVARRKIDRVRIHAKFRGRHGIFYNSITNAAVTTSSCIAAQPTLLKDIGDGQSPLSAADASLTNKQQSTTPFSPSSDLCASSSLPPPSNRRHTKHQTVLNETKTNHPLTTVYHCSKQLSIKRDKTPEQLSFLKQALFSFNENNVFLYASYEPTTDPLKQSKFLDAMKGPISYNSGTVIIREGDVGDYFYVIEEGTVGIYKPRNDLLDEKYSTQILTSVGDNDKDAANNDSALDCGTTTQKKNDEEICLYPWNELTDRSAAKQVEKKEVRFKRRPLFSSFALQPISVLKPIVTDSVTALPKMPEPSKVEKDSSHISAIDEAQEEEESGSEENIYWQHSKDPVFTLSSANKKRESGTTLYKRQRSRQNSFMLFDSSLTTSSAEDRDSVTDRLLNVNDSEPRDLASSINIGVRQITVDPCSSSSRASYTNQDNCILHPLPVPATAITTESKSLKPFGMKPNLFSCASERRIKELGPGDTFGEVALFYNCPRVATYIAESPKVKVWRIDAQTFRSVMSDAESSISSDYTIDPVEDTLKRVDILKDLDERTLVEVARGLTPVTFRKGERIIQKNEIGDLFFIVKTGTVRIHDIGYGGDAQWSDMIVKPGEWFGERSLLTGARREANVTAESDVVTTLVMSRETFQRRFGKLQDLLEVAFQKKQLMAIPSFSHSKLEAHEIDALLKLQQRVTFRSGEIIATAGKKTRSAIYLVQSGKIQMTCEKTHSVNTLKKGDHFGGRTLRSKSSTTCISGQTIEVLEDSECAVLSRRAIESVIGNISRLSKALPPVSSKLDRTIKLEHLKKQRVIGIGSFGTVWLVQHKKKKSMYAMKVISKIDIINRKLTKCVIRERNIMASIDHPFILDLITSLQDLHSVYLLTKFVQGGELFTVMHSATSDRISDDMARFYGACILESLSHLHRRNIVYRDLKPENVLIDRDGYCILVDMGFAKVVLDKTYTTCGTPEYLAPEIILGWGHSREVDDWAFGSMLYEMLIGQTPFNHAKATQVSLMKRIIKNRFAFPTEEKHGIAAKESAKHLIKGLLAPDPNNRIGCFAKGDNRDIRLHPWFEGILGNGHILAKKTKAPWIPDIKNAMDASYFDYYQTAEKSDGKTMQRPILSKKQQEMFKPFCNL